ncbi:peptidoglycan DD-metalloendopeptidase family protein [Iodobacter sp. CM08]|uniref:peptidoglycan DD-metalloendopeptidase family protein n=1 Tax=Iodobacter sp. CM08 TaxID=3085902 RepID=UPI0029812505|nr:peptidoglycan DD-metalloendopeptidase family protein [Iodobacter sp. CM08]MDW5417935.1 peptidoglycan DD-metalloendopeptidase family protein [Iodobacter sp. CM08]
MIISPPLLKTAQGNQSDEDWLKGLMPFGSRGNYPISSLLAWHGGQHIEHTDTGPRGEPVRAIADGKVMFARKPSPLTGENAKPDLAINGGSSDGCVIIKHSTEIGEGPDGQVEYYSIYMHLKQVFVQKNQPVYRKAELGSVGQCNGNNAMHMEIICDDANLKKLVGREEGNLDLSKDGRMDAVYGDMHFYLPAGATFYATQPSANSQTGAGTPAYTSTTPLFISMRFEKGDCKMSTRQENSEILGEYICIGNEIIETDYEYNLYKAATTLANRNEIAPSSMYELLHFGRVINIDNETAIPAGAVPHWRKVNYPDGQGWVNLNAVSIKKYSDADFPHWMGWNLIADDATPDSQCNSPTLLAWLDSDGDKKYTSRELQQALSQEQMLKKLSRTICKFPTEWEVATLNTRYEWIKTESDLLEIPLDPEQYENFIKLTTALCFWAEAGLGIAADHWHFHPKEFIGHFTKCGWLAEREILRCIPLTYQSNRGNRNTPIIRNNITTAVAKTRITERNYVVFMKINRKYGLRKVRLAHFLAQVYQETGVLKWAQELASGSEYENREDLGNTMAGDGIKFKGRGLIQLTGRANYAKYSDYKGLLANDRYTVEPRNVLISDSPYESAETAGLYWISRNVRNSGINISRVADLGVEEAHVRSVTKNVNGAEDALWTGLVARRSHLQVTKHVLLDGVDILNIEKVRDDV